MTTDNAVHFAPPLYRAETVAETKEPMYHLPFQVSQIVPWVSAATFLFLYLLH